MMKTWRRYNRTNAANTIRSYLKNLKNERHVSKLSLAAEFTSDKILKLVGKYQESVTRSQDNVLKLIADKEEMTQQMCVRTYLYPLWHPLLGQWLAKQNDHYNRISVYEKAAMKRYFMPTINSTVYRRMLRKDKGLYFECRRAVRQIMPSYNITTFSLQQLTTFKNKLDSFLLKTRLNGTFFRYVSVV